MYERERERKRERERHADLFSVAKAKALFCMLKRKGSFPTFRAFGCEQEWLKGQVTFLKLW